jgi:hypothetical protein
LSTGTEKDKDQPAKNTVFHGYVPWYCKNIRRKTHWGYPIEIHPLRRGVPVVPILPPVKTGVFTQRRLEAEGPLKTKP